MVFDLSQVTGIGDYTSRTEPSGKASASASSSEVAAPSAAGPAADGASRTLYLKPSAEPSAHLPVFLVDNGNTIEVRSDEKLIALLTEKYESVMKSRYFGSGGLEIVLAGHQLPASDLADLIRLSYNLTH